MGFTNDQKNIWNGELLNLGYQYILREDEEFWFAIHLHRLLDANFGGWDGYQLALHETFETEYVEECIYALNENRFAELWELENCI